MNLQFVEWLQLVQYTSSSRNRYSPEVCHSHTPFRSASSASSGHTEADIRNVVSVGHHVYALIDSDLICYLFHSRELVCEV